MAIPIFLYLVPNFTSTPSRHHFKLKKEKKPGHNFLDKGLEYPSSIILLDGKKN
jgi:hypothetical protein